MGWCVSDSLGPEETPVLTCLGLGPVCLLGFMRHPIQIRKGNSFLKTENVSTRDPRVSGGKAPGNLLGGVVLWEPLRSATCVSQPCVHLP